ncbi:MAG: peptidoglycan-associated lipoprotein Pal [Gammaproteobacteria bacterium]|nr:peptidoglycan-associated lipoprotein Pal [Gammaproteobacteria bacterium]
MTKQWLRSLFVITLASLFIAGCASSGSQTEPAEPSAGPVETPDTTPAPVAPPAEPPAFDANGNPFVPGTGRLLSRTYYFDYDRAVISPDDLAALEMHATILRNNRDRSIVLEGHCDERGTREYNLALGERRGDAIRSFLTSAGVSPRQIETVSYGEERPEDPGHTEGAWTRNRRAVMIYR